jgi:exopolysaccharide biosynthesis polyprenyl glycosylphosphotransferase
VLIGVSMDGATSASDIARSATSSVRGGLDIRSDTVELNHDFSANEGVMHLIAVGQIVCLTVAMLVTLLTRQQTDTLSVANFSRNIVLLCGFAIQASYWTKKCRLANLRDTILEMAQRGLSVAALVFVSAALSAEMNDASWDQLYLGRTFVFLLLVGWSGLAVLAILDWWHRRASTQCLVVFGDSDSAFSLAQQIRSKMPRAKVCLYSAAQLQSRTAQPEEPGMPLHADPKLVELAPRVAMISSFAGEKMMDELVSQLAPLSLDVLVHASHGSRWTSGPMTSVAGVPFVRIFPKPLRPHQVALKRAFDLVISSVFLVLLLPVLCFIAIAIKIDSRGPMLFRQPRVGRGRSHFTVYKFRTMRAEATDLLAEQPTVMNDPRLTRIGTILRKLSLDELPQLFNVLTGSMSIVGPRPHAMNGNDFSSVIPNYHARHRVRPGITGLAQVLGWRGPADTQIKIEQRVANDLRYISEWSMTQDLLIVARTIFALCGKNAF